MNEPRLSLDNLPVDSSWTLFLDRDGVINVHYPDDYVKRWEDFIFIEGVTEALARLSSVFGRIVVVTNQQGVGKGLYTEAELAQMHQQMSSIISQAGGRIDAVYAATRLRDEDVEGWRKPKTGMALQARADFPDIDFSKSIMVGDSASDMQFGREAGMYTVFVKSPDELTAEQQGWVDFYRQGLPALLRI